MVLTFILGTLFGVIGLISTDGVSVIRWLFSTDNLLSSNPKIITDTKAASYLNICLNGKLINNYLIKTKLIIFYIESLQPKKFNSIKF